MSNADLVLSY